MGIGPARARGSQQILDRYFATNVNGPHWQAQYNEYLDEALEAHALRLEAREARRRRGL